MADLTTRTPRSDAALAKRRVRHLMAVFYRMLGTWYWTERVKRRWLPTPEARDLARDAMWTRLGDLYRTAAVTHGGLLIKVGQLLSARADLFPPAFTRALSGLQDTVPGVPFPEVRAVVEQAFGRPLEEVFGTFDEVPLAAASLGLVHRATLPDGRPVVVKVLRPGVETLIRADLEGFRQMVRFLLRWTRWAKHIDLAGIYYESWHILTRELDLRDEAEHTRRFARMFANEPDIEIPTVYDDFTRQRVLTLSFMAGRKITEAAEAGVDPRAVAKLLITALARQVLVEGFFHADPHPGNLLVRQGPNGPILVILDFGMVGRLTPRHLQGFSRLAAGLLAQDPDGFVAGLDHLEMLRNGADRLALRRAIAWLMERQMAGNLFALPPRVFLEIARELRQIMTTQAFLFPSDITFLGRGASTTFGVARTLDPDGDFIASIETAVREHLGRGAGRGVGEVLGELAKLPARLDRVLTVIEKGAAPGTPHAAPTAESRRIAWGHAAGVLWLGGCIFYVGASAEGAIAAWTAAALTLVVWAYLRLPPAPDEP